MIEEIAQYLRNKEKSPGNMLEMLGEWKSVEELSAIWKRAKPDLKLARAALLTDFCNTMEFSKENYFFYRLGIDALFRLFEACDNDIEARRILEKNKVESKQ